MKKTYQIILSVTLLLFSANFSVAQKILSPRELKEDLKVMKMTLKELHPGLYRYNTPLEMERKFDGLESKLNKPLSDGEFFLLFSQLLSEIKCYHTYPNLLNQKDEVKNDLFNRANYFPFYFEIIERKMVVTENASAKKLAKGSEITKINGISTQKIIEKLLTSTFADGNGTMDHRLKTLEVDRSSGADYAIFDIIFPLFFPPKNGAYALEAIDFKSKKLVKFSGRAMMKSDRTAEMETRYGKTPVYDDGWRFEIWQDGTAYLKISHFITWKLGFDYKEFLAKAFAEMKQKSSKNLIVDIRGNGGGDNGASIEILRGIAKEPFPCKALTKTYIKTAKPDEEVFRYAETYDKELENALRNGVPESLYKKSKNGLLEFLGDSADCEQHQPLNNGFVGNTYLVVDSANASAAFTMAQTAKEYKLATLVGQTTGGNKRGFNGGSYLFTYLPNSKFEFDLPVFAYLAQSPQEDEGIEPDILIERKPEDIGNDFDRELTVVKGLMNNQ